MAAIKYAKKGKLPEATNQLGEGIFSKRPKINIGKLHDLHAYHEKKAEAHATAEKKYDSNSKMADHHSEQGYEHENAADHLHNASKAYDKGDHKAVAKHLDMYHKTPVARQGIKEAAKQIDEVSNNTLTKYAKASYNDILKRRANRPAGQGDESDPKIGKRLAMNKLAHKKGAFKEAKDHGNMNNGSPAGEGLSPSAKKELARKTPMPDIVNEPVIDKKTFDAIRASGKKAPMRNNDNAQGDKTPPKGK